MLLGFLDSLVIVTTNIGSGYVPVSYSFDFASFWQAVLERGQESPSSSLSSPSIFPPSSFPFLSSTPTVQYARLPLLDHSPSQRIDIEIVDGSERGNVYLSKKSVKGETRLAVTTHENADVGVCFRNYLDYSECWFCLCSSGLRVGWELVGKRSQGRKGKKGRELNELELTSSPSLLPSYRRAQPRQPSTDSGAGGRYRS